MTSPALMKNLGAFMLPEGEGGDESAADGAFVSGAIVDREDKGNAQCLMALVGVAFTSSSGAPGGKVDLLLEVLGDSDAAMASATSLGTLAYEYAWVADGANSGLHYLPVKLDLSTSERYVRVRAKLTKGGTITVAQGLTVGLLLGGLDYVSDPEYDADGVSQTTEPV